MPSRYRRDGAGFPISRRTTPAANHPLGPRIGASLGPGEPVAGFSANAGELLTIEIKVAASMVWAFLREVEIDPRRTRSPTRVAFSASTNKPPELHG